MLYIVWIIQIIITAYLCVYFLGKPEKVKPTNNTFDTNINNDFIK